MVERIEKGTTANFSGPPRSAVAITPDDTELANTLRGFYVGVGGDVAVVYEDDTVAVTLVGVPTGATIVGYIKQINSTNTTATNIIGLY